jgi:ribosome-associated protein
LKDTSPKKKFELIAKAALAKKARDVVLIDLRKLSYISDYFIIASGDSIVQLDAIANNIERELLNRNCRLWHREGRGEALWILLDYGDIVVHIFYKETRGFYNLEKLWHDAPQRKLKDSTFIKKRKRTSKKESYGNKIVIRES